MACMPEGTWIQLLTLLPDLIPLFPSTRFESGNSFLDYELETALLKNY